METAHIPHLDKPVSRIVCGTDWLFSTVPHESFKALDAYWEAGGRIFDTAYGYGPNTNILAAWANSRNVTHEAMYFDKGCHPHGGQNRVTAEDALKEIKENHRRLGVERNDFFTYHRDDLSVPVAEIVDWTNEYIQMGLISVYGGSNWTHERIAEANAYAEKNGKQGFSLNNPNLTLAHNTKPLWDNCLTIVEDGRAWHKETQFPLFSWSSTGRGYFARVNDNHVNESYDNPISSARRERAEELGKKYDASATQIALAWVLCQPYPVFALCGLRTPDNVKENIKALDIKLSQAELDYLEHGTPLS